jgi:hypothetical protein
MINVLQAMIMTDKDKMVLTPTHINIQAVSCVRDATFVPVSFNAGSYVPAISHCLAWMLSQPGTERAALVKSQCRSQ